MNELRMCRRRIRLASAGEIRQGYRGLPKRLLDIFIALVALIIFSLPMIIAAVAIRIEDGGSVIFQQERVGVGGKIFVCYKFRTMRDSTPHNCASAKLEHPERYITRVGGILRRSSIDELPQLFNVLMGDMSLIGPRPVIACETELVELRESLGVYAIRPGMTGLAQVRGRDSLSIRRKAALDAQYAENVSFAYDVSLLLKTMLCVIFCGASYGRTMVRGTDSRAGA